MRITDQIKSDAWLYVATAMLAVLLLIPVFGLQNADLKVPIFPGGDETFYQGIFAKPLATQLWYQVNPNLGAPDKMYLYDFPTGTDSANYLGMKLIAMVVRDSGLTINLFFLLGFPLTAVTMLFAARYLKLQRAVAVMVALLYAFAPYHIYRSEGHLLLGVFYLWPLGLVVALEVDRLLGEPAEDGAPATFNTWKSIFTSKTFIASCIISAWIAVSGVYYAFFYGLMLVVIALRRVISRRTWRSVVVPAILGVVILATTVASVAPGLIFDAQHGTNKLAAVRTTADAETYALRPVQLIIPSYAHGIASWRAISVNYNNFLGKFNPGLNNETKMAALGVFGSLGFAFLIVWSVLGGRSRRDGPWAQYRLGDLATINLTMLLLGTVGGLGFLVAAVITPMIRGYNRVSIVIAMVAVLATGAVIDRTLRRFPRIKWLPVLVAIVLVPLGVLDQAPVLGSVQGYAAAKAADTIQRDFGAATQKYLPAGTMVFQLPYTAFPGTGTMPAGFGEYDLLVPYMYSDGLKWSFGALRGRRAAKWQESVAILPVPQMLKKIKARGFSAVYVDRFGYVDKGAQIIADIEASLGQPGVQSADGRMLLWRLK